VAVLRRLSSGERAQAMGWCGSGGKTRGAVFRRRGKQGLAAELGRRAQAAELGWRAQAAELGRRAQAVELGQRAQAAEVGRRSWGRCSGSGAMASGQAKVAAGKVSREREIRHTHPCLEERGMDWFDRFGRLSRSHVFGEYSLCVDGSISVYCNQTNAYWGWFHPIHVLVQNQTHA
jgi:hypothetical protein